MTILALYWDNAKVNGRPTNISRLHFAPTIYTFDTIGEIAQNKGDPQSLS